MRGLADRNELAGSDNCANCDQASFDTDRDPANGNTQSGSTDRDSFANANARTHVNINVHEHTQTNSDTRADEHTSAYCAATANFHPASYVSTSTDRPPSADGAADSCANAETNDASSRYIWRRHQNCWTGHPGRHIPHARRQHLLLGAAERFWRNTRRNRRK